MHRLSSRRAIPLAATAFSLLLLAPFAFAPNGHSQAARLLPATGSRTGASYTVFAGLGSTRDGRVDVNAFQPKHIVVHVGDTITFVSLGFHTVAFESARPFPGHACRG